MYEVGMRETKVGAGKKGGKVNECIGARQEGQ